MTCCGSTFLYQIVLDLPIHSYIIVYNMKLHTVYDVLPKVEGNVHEMHQGNVRRYMHRKIHTCVHVCTQL